MDIYLIRHTPVATAPGICYGRSDVAVAATYPEDAASVRARLASVLDAGPVAVHASPLRRCQQLAEALAPQSVRLDSRLMEYNFGRWELLPWAAVPAPEREQWKADFVNLPAPDGETFQGLQDRATEFLTDVLASAAPQVPLLIVSHSAVIRSLICYCLGLPLSQAFRFDVDYGSITKVRYQQGQLQVAYING
ncbi:MULTISPECIES: alpha-ribazole phosphatase family protein [Hymenobacter]|uniref:Alpha-ribazole phosphatase n=1 Tax=Hymenobacter mucosus TaxID=1411120 RepID=A0A238VAS1_9BACT|nr:MULTISPECIES: alpha-ribazole phosphatase family protein [Hymenobacter]SNR31495.1 alpha-ribazole phosphatase [Hymenobacter mucosus]